MMTPCRTSSAAVLPVLSVFLFTCLTASCNGQRAYSPAQTPQGSGQASGQPAASRQNPGHSQAVSFTPSQKHRIEDPVYGVTYGTVTIPAGWGFSGGVNHAQTCAITGPGPAYAMQSPDGNYGLLIAPELTAGASNDPQQNQQMRQQGCQPSTSSSAADFARTNFLPHLGLQNMKIVSVGPAPALDGLARQYRDQAQQLAAGAPRMQYAQTKNSVDTALVHVSFESHGRPMDGLVGLLLACFDNRQAYPGMAPMVSHQCTAESLAFVFAPPGQSDFALKQKVFEMQVNPAWNEHRQQEVNNQMAAQNQRNQNNANAMAAQHQSQMAQQQANFERGQAAHQAQMQGYAQHNSAEMARQDAVHGSAQAYAAHVGDYNDYTNTQTGQTVRLSNQYDNTYVNSQGTVALQTNQAGSPGVDWSMMVPRFK